MVSVIFIAWSAHVSALTKATPAATLVLVSLLLAIVLLFKSRIIVHIRVKSSSPAHFAVSSKLATTSYFAASSHLAVSSEAHGWRDFKLFNFVMMGSGVILLLQISFSIIIPGRLNVEIVTTPHRRWWLYSATHTSTPLSTASVAANWCYNFGFWLVVSGLWFSSFPSFLLVCNGFRSFLMLLVPPTCP